MGSKYIDNLKIYWGYEFAGILNIPYQPEFDDVAGMGAYTMLFKIADEFEDGKYRAEILKQFGIVMNDGVIE